MGVEKKINERFPRGRLIGLTGGIGTGKTTVSNYLAKVYGLPILDADLLAREAVQPGSPVWKSIVTHYGDLILLEDGTLNRQKLGDIVFSNVEERRWLEAQIHPDVRQRLLEGIQHLMRGEGREDRGLITVVLAVPLLFEANFTDLCTEIWVVYCEPEQQLERVSGRGNISLAQAQARIESQLPLLEKCRQADVVLDNSSTLEVLYQQVDLLMQAEATVGSESEIT